MLENTLLIILVLLALGLSIWSLVKGYQDHFADVGPYAPDATKSGWYYTFHRECQPGLHRCKVQDPWNHDYYFCASNCTLKPEHLKGTPLKGFIPWEQRFA